MDINKYIGEKIRAFRQSKNINQEELAEYLGVTVQAVSRYELGDRKTDNDVLFKLADYFNVSVNDFFPTISFDNADLVDINTDTISIPVLGVIKAGIPIEAQENILEYIDIPKDWLRGGKTFYGLKISGDSMYPKYQTDDIVIFEKNEDMNEADNHDCAVLINGFDATFKKFKLSQNGITLIPYNQDNTDGFETTYYDSDQVQKLPIKIIGIAREKRTRL